jgi:phosphocarrier protein HPr
MLQRTVIITNRLGLHARAAAKLVKLANAFASEVQLARADAPEKQVDAKSILSTLLLAATQGAALEIVCVGTDEEAALAALCQLIEDKFGEE